MRQSLTFLILLFGISSNGFAVKPDKQEIINTRNFFLISDDLRYPQHEHLYSYKFYQERTDIHPKELVIRRAFREGFDIRKEIKTLFMANLDKKIAAAELMPSLYVEFTTSMVPLDLGSLLGNLLGFMFPYEWLDLASAQFRYKAARFSMIEVLLQKYRDIMTEYLEAHRMARELEIISFHIAHLKILAEDKNSKTAHALEPAGQDHAKIEEDPTQVIEVYADKLKSMSAEIIANLGNSLLGLARIAVYEEGDWSHFAIEDLGILDKPQGSDAALDKTAFLEQALKNSMRIQMFRALIREARTNTMATIPNNVLNNQQMFQSLSIALGISIVPRTIRVRVQQKVQEINLEETVFDIKERVEKAIYMQETAITRYEKALKFYETMKPFITGYIKTYVTEETLPEPFCDAHDNLLTAELNVNNALHDYLKSQIELDVLAVDPVLSGPLLKHLPKKREVRKLLAWLSKKRGFNGVSMESLDTQLTSINTSKGLIEFIDHVNQKNGKTMIKTLLEKNLDHMLNHKHPNDYFITLKELIQTYDIALTKPQKMKLHLLRKKKLSPVSRASIFILNKGHSREIN